MKGIVYGVLLALVVLAAPAPAGTQRPEMDWDSWLFWWAYNREEFVSPPPARLAPEDAERVADALETAALSEKLHPDIRGAAVIALARCPESRRRLDVMLTLLDRKGEQPGRQNIREAAALAIAIAQPREEKARRALVALIEDGDVRLRPRCIAAVSLALLPNSSADAFPLFTRRLESADTPLELSRMMLFAIGLTGDADRVPELLGWLRGESIGKRSLDDLDRALLIESLGRIGDRKALPAVLGSLGSRGIHTRRSSAIAAGQLLLQTEPGERAKAASLLVDRAHVDPDRSVRQFAMMALARIGMAPDCPDGLREKAEATLATRLGEASHESERALAGIGLGLLARADRSRIEPTADRLGATLGRTPEGEGLRGGLAMALGLTGDRRPATVARLVQLADDDPGNAPRERSPATLALGLVGARAEGDTVLAALREMKNRDHITRAALAAARLGDSRGTGLLLAQLEDPDNRQFRIGSAALALGATSEPRAIEPLLRILEPTAENGKYPDLTRALAAVALGQIANPRETSVLSRICRDVNYRSTVPSLEELLTFL